MFLNLFGSVNDSKLSRDWVGRKVFEGFGYIPRLGVSLSYFILTL